MWEFEILNNQTGEVNMIFGYSLSDAFRRSPSLNPDDWTCINRTYAD